MMNRAAINPFNRLFYWMVAVFLLGVVAIMAAQTKLESVIRGVIG